MAFASKIFSAIGGKARMEELGIKRYRIIGWQFLMDFPGKWEVLSISTEDEVAYTISLYTHPHCVKIACESLEEAVNEFNKVLEE